MPAAGFQIMQLASFDKPHKLARRQAGKQYGIVERDEFLFASALFAKKLKTQPSPQNEKFVAARYGGNFPGAFCH
jgi:hypothetical protein